MRAMAKWSGAVAFELTVPLEAEAGDYAITSKRRAKGIPTN